jgi:tetratricopeptide (TPR) repeat protein
MTPKTCPVLLACLLWSVSSLAQSDVSSELRPLETSVRSGTASREQQINLARLYVQAGRYYEASKITRSLLNQNASDQEVIAIRDEAARGLREVNDRAVAEAEANARRDGATEADRVALADAYFNAGSYGAAAEQYGRLDATTDRELRLRHARSLAWSGRLDPAERIYADLVRDGSSPELELEYGQLLSWMGASKAALARLEQLNATSPSEQVVLALANARAWNNDREGAIKLLTDYTASHPESSDASKLLGELQTSPELRIERADRLIQAEPYNLALRLEKARLLVDAKRYSAALRVIRFIEDHSGGDTDGLDELRTRAREGQREEIAAMKARLGALDTRDPQSADEMLSLAKAYTGAEGYDEAITLYRRYLEIRPDDVDARIAYARVLSWDKRWSAADAEYRRILANEPERADLRLEHAQVLSYDKNYVSAIREFRALTDISSNPRAHLYPEVPQRAYFNLGQIYRWFGWNEHAVEEQNEAIRLDGSYLPAREELDRVRHVRPASSLDLRYSYNTDSNDFTLRRIDANAELWRTQRMALQIGAGKHFFEHAGDEVDANVLSAGLTYRLRDRLTARGNAGLTFYGEGLGTRPFFGAGVEFIPNIQSRAAVDYNHYDLVYDVFTLSTLTIPSSGATAFGDPISIDDFRGHYDWNSGGIFSFLGDVSHGFISDGNDRNAAHGLATFRIVRAPFVALKVDGRWLSYDERVNRYWSPTDYKSLAGVLQVGSNFRDRVFWDAEVKYGRSWEGDRESDLRTYSARVTVPINDAIDLVGNYGYGKSGRLESVFGNNGQDFVNYWQRHWYVGVRLKRLFGGSDRDGTSNYYYDNRVLTGSPLASPVGESR